MDEDYYKGYSPTQVMGKSPLGKRALYRNQEESVESTAYIDYPKHKPFINDDYERPSSKPISAYPENNRRAVISALKKLQDKIHKLEIERSAAEDNLKSLASETNKYRDIFQRDPEPKEPTQTQVSKNSQELESQLLAAETRCNLLEKQLGYMRQMVQSSEQEHQEAVSIATTFDRGYDISRPGFNNYKDKIADLEREHLKLTANQNLAELESVASTNRLLMRDEEIHKPSTKPKRAGKKKKKAVSKKSQQVHHTKPDDMKHYRLNLADIPFVAGKSTNPSYSVGANVQNVLSLMKTHNMALCSKVAYPMNTCRSMSPSTCSSASNSLDNDLADLLLQLQDEFHHMSFEHQELSKQINEATDFRVREDLERELDALVTRMEAKSQQISKVRKHQQKILEKIKKKKSMKKAKEELPPRPRSAACYYDSPRSSSIERRNGEVEVTTTITTKGPGAGLVRLRPSSGREVSLNVLRDMKKLQTTLRKDDFTWE
ncbi:hypothetical protein ACJMK2_030278 [Sinanodonta woodiana]|uniref:Centrosomal protein of 57 kDa n=1 Tax=Sinanodonta woodiana TaxID=1069815 RepID=A0ABD3XE87_SINWO